MAVKKKVVKKKASGEICSTCAHWADNGEDNTLNDCRRFPPVNRKFEETKASCFCGEYKKK